MKYIILFLVCLSHFKIKAQTDSTSLTERKRQLEISIGGYINSDYYNSYTRAIIRLKDHSVLHVEQITTHNNYAMVEYNKKKLPLNPIYNIPVENIRSITFKRGAFGKGILAGALLGAGLAAVYLKNHEDSRNDRGSLYVTLGILPLGLAGGVLGYIFTKKHLP